MFSLDELKDPLKMNRDYQVVCPPGVRMALRNKFKKLIVDEVIICDYQNVMDIAFIADPLVFTLFVPSSGILANYKEGDLFSWEATLGVLTLTKVTA